MFKFLKSLFVPNQESNKIENKYEGCEYIYYPIISKYAVTVYGRFPFYCVGGYYTLHSTVSYNHQFSSKEEAKRYLDKYLEWCGKDTIISKVE